MSLKVALLTYATKPRGSVVHTLELADALAKLGHQPTVFALDKDGKGLYRNVGFKTYAVPASSCDQGIEQLIKQRIEEFVTFFDAFLEQHPQPYDIYHAQDCLSANALAALKAKGKIARFVRTVHHIENFKSPYLQSCQEKSIYQSDRCLCVSQVWQQALKQDYGIPAHRVTNGVSSRFSPQPTEQELALHSMLKKDYGLSPSARPIYLTIGGIEPRKNSIRLLKAFAQVQQQKPNAKLIIAGGATLFDYQDYRQDFMALVKALNLTDALVLPGVVADDALPALYRLADAFVFPSVQEGWGLVVLEAIASGIPVLTANQAPFTEFLSNSSARLIDPTDIDAIAQAMTNITEPSVSQQLVQNSQKVIERYSWEASAKKHLALYHQLV